MSDEGEFRDPDPRQGGSPGESEAPRILGIAGSAGGLRALEQLFAALGPSPGAGIVVIMHLDPRRVSYLRDLLARVAQFPVEQIQDGMRVERDRAYVSPPGSALTIVSGVLRLEPPETGGGLPIDHFLESLARDQGTRATAIILSGMGMDGTRGIEAIKARSGLVLAQEPEEAEYPSMPVSAIATGLVDHVLTVAQMPGRLAEPYAGPSSGRTEPPVADLDPEPRPAASKTVIQGLLDLVHGRTGKDFSAYKSPTIRRRIDRRMAILKIDTYERYAAYLAEHEPEADLLAHEFLIGVTSFFRDQGAFSALQRALTTNLADRRLDDPFRVWVPGCSTGEEALSIAMLLDEIREAGSLDLTIQIFATDLDETAIRLARSGLYARDAVATLDPARRERYFVQEGERCRIRKVIRECVVYAPHNMIKDPPFTRIDLVSCRNLLIYIDATLQRRLIPLFHYVLNPNGLLLLGASETVGDFSGLFETVDRSAKLFRRIGSNQSRPAPREPSRALAAVRPESVLTKPEEAPFVSDRDLRFRTLLAERFAPPTVIATETGEIVYIHGRTGQFLEPAAGVPTNNLLTMARSALRAELALALREASRTDEEIRRCGLTSESAGEAQTFDLLVRKLRQPEDSAPLLSISFCPPEGPVTTPPRRSRSGPRSRASSKEQELETELLLTREALRHASSEFEGAREKLQSANEELQGMNEELQSTNEELETSKEEMQSLNEELQTLNAELHGKVEDLSEVNDDMANFLNAVDVGTIFLDRTLRVRRFTTPAQKVVRLIPTDVGRPLSDIVSHLRYDQFEEDAREVLRTLVFKEVEVSSNDGTSYLMRVMPYRTSGNVIDGLVMTFVDITDLKNAQATSRELAQMWKSLVENLSDGILTIDRQGQIERVFRPGGALPPGPEVGASLLDRTHPDDRETVRRCLSHVIASRRASSYEARGANPPRDTTWFVHRISPLLENDEVKAMTLVIIDPGLQAEVEFSGRTGPGSP